MFFESQYACMFLQAGFLLKSLGSILLIAVLWWVILLFHLCRDLAMVLICAKFFECSNLYMKFFPYHSSSLCSQNSGRHVAKMLNGEDEKLTVISLIFLSTRVYCNTAFSSMNLMMTYSSNHFFNSLYDKYFNNASLLNAYMTASSLATTISPWNGLCSNTCNSPKYYPLLITCTILKIFWFFLSKFHCCAPFGQQLVCVT